VPVEITAASTLPKEGLPRIRQWVGSALYVLTSPAEGDGSWQSWGQVLSQQLGLSVIVWCDGPNPIENPTFADIKNIMQGYAALYPAMTNMIDIGSQAVLDDPTSAKKFPTSSVCGERSRSHARHPRPQSGEARHGA
jgi:hypothetical protein